MSKKIKFPRSLYKKEGPEKLYSAGKVYEYSKVDVNNKEQMDLAIDEGYSDDFSIVTSNEEVVAVEKKEEVVKEDNFEDDF
jgi:hypothetical protein